MLRIDFAELNLWVDQATNVVTRLTLQANDEADGSAVSLEVLFDYYDFNAAIDIQAPATAGEPIDPGMADTDDGSAPGDALCQLLG